MADIFISYARPDRARAERLAQVLGEHGWTVWWDRHIPPGKTFDAVIEEALADAKCVIVLWSNDSVKSEWVKAEASDAARRRILVPILADDVKIPLEFRRIQTARLIDWANLTANRDWDQLSQALAAMLGTEVRIQSTIVPDPRPPNYRVVGGAAAAIAIVVAVVLLGVLSWRRTATPDTRAQTPPAAVPVAPSRTDANEPVAPAPQKPSEASVRRSPPSRTEAAQTVAPPEQPVVVQLPRKPRASNPVKPVNTVDAVVAVTTTPLATPSAVTSREPLRPNESDSTEFDVTYAHGVFRREAGRLNISPAGVRYEGTASSRGTRAGFEISCDDVKKVDIPNVIVDGEQRMLELRLRDRSYRLAAANTTTRDGIVAALSKTCGPR